MGSGTKHRPLGDTREPQGSAEASAEVRRQRRRRTESRRTEETRHEARREAEVVTAPPEVKNRFLAEAEVRTSASRTADTVTFVEVEAVEAGDRRGGGKGDSWQKYDKSKCIFSTLDVTNLNVKICSGRVNIYRRELVPNLFLSKWIFTCKFHFVVNCSVESLKASFSHLQSAGLGRSLNQ